MTLTLDLSSKSIARVFYIATAVVLLMGIMYAAIEVIGVLAIAVFLAVATNAPVTYLNHKLPFFGRKVAALIVFAAIGAVISLIVYLIIPLIVEQGQELIFRLPGYIESLRSGDTALSLWLLEINFFEHLEAFLVSVFEGIVNSAGTTTEFIMSIMNNVINILFTVVIGFAFVVEAPSRIDSMDSFLPEKMKEPISILRGRMYEVISGFVHGQLIITTLAASFTFILLTILGVPSPFSLAAVIWLTGLIPMVGNTLGAIVVIAVALSQSLGVALFLTGYYIIYQQVENNVFEPLIQAKSTHLTPLVVLASVVIGVHIGGFVGAVLAIPAGACVLVAVEYIFEKLRPDSRKLKLTGDAT